MTTKKYYILKWIAIFTMLTDHIAIILDGCISLECYIAMRTVGRIAFPLFCYMIAESFYFTTNPKRHLQRLLLLAVISEIPYDYSMYGVWFDLSNRNVIFTLALGFFALLVTKNKVYNILKIFKSTKQRNFLLLYCGLI